LNKISLWC